MYYKIKQTKTNLRKIYTPPPVLHKPPHTLRVPVVFKLYTNIWSFNLSIYAKQKKWLDIQAILTGLGLQHKTVDSLTQELELPANQLLALFNRSMRKLAGNQDTDLTNQLVNSLL